VLDLETGQVTLVLPFGPPGDYEGVELAGSRLFMLRADGTLFELEGWEGGETRTREIASGLEADCDAEGLGFGEARNRLLIACKAGGEESGGRRAIYSFDLERMALDAQPAFVIAPEHVEGERKLAPSARAVHPVTGHVVVLSSAREVLVALAPDGTVADVWDWTEAGFEQPEGLAFLPNGDLFIASEVARQMSYQVAAQQDRGEVPNYEASMVKLFSSELSRRVATAAVNILGLRGQLLRGSSGYEVDDGRIATNLSGSIPSVIAGGTSEIQRNIIATRGLGLPRG